MTAEEFFRKRNVPLNLKEDKEIAFWAKEAEAYYKSKVEAITEEDIEKKYPSDNGRLCYNDARREGIQWFKEKLLKQIT